MPLQITPTERHALQLLANGYTTRDVATDLGMGTVETEVLLKRLFAALGAATRVEAIALARKRGLVSWDPVSYRPPGDAGYASAEQLMSSRGCNEGAAGHGSSGAPMGVIDMFELIAAALIAIRRWSPKLSGYGSLMASATFVVTLSFLFTTPGALSPASPANGFLLKDILLLGAALFTAAEALRAARGDRS